MPCRKLSKKVQTSLADANGVADEVLASMTTVKAHAAEASANKTYADRLHKFYILQVEMAASRRQHLPADGSLQAYGSTCKPVETPASPQQHLQSAAFALCARLPPPSGCRFVSAWQHSADKGSQQVASQDEIQHR